MVGFTVSADTRKLDAVVDALPRNLREALFESVRSIDEALVSAARAMADGDLIRQRTGAYLASIRGDVWQGRHRIGGSIEASVPYAGILEYGGTVPAHDIAPNAKQALAFLMSAGEVYAALIHHPADRIEKRAVLHKALDSMEGQIAAELTERMRAVVGATLQAADITGH